MQMPTTHLAKLLTALTLVSLALLASGALANPSLDDKSKAAPVKGEELSDAREEVASNQGIVSEPQSFNIVYCESKCDFFWDWCVDASSQNRICHLIDFEWCLTANCPQNPPTNEDITQAVCCWYGGFGSSTY